VAIEIRDFSRSIANPKWHYRLIGSQVVYRLWDETKYFGGNRSYEQVQEHQLFCTLHKAIKDGIRPMETLFRNLTDASWWNRRNRPDGRVELHVDVQDRNHHHEFVQAGQMAEVALAAIKAYRAYVAAGGDPSQLPMMSFDGSEFAVSLKHEDSI
jgi:hypothetical protein